MGARATTARTLLVLGAAVCGVAILDARTPPWTTSAGAARSAPSDAGEVARLVEACKRDGRPRRGEWGQGSAPWFRLAELGPDAAPALPLLLERLRTTGLLYGAERDTMVGLGAPALAGLVGLLVDPNVAPTTVEVAAAIICDLEEDALGALDGFQDLPDGLRDDIVAWVRVPGRHNRAPKGALHRLDAFLLDPVPSGPAGAFGSMSSDPCISPQRSPQVSDDPFARAAAALQLPSVPEPLETHRQRTLILRPAVGMPVFDEDDGVLICIDPTVVPRWPPAAFDVLAFAMPMSWTVLAKGTDRWICGIPDDLQVHVFGTLGGRPFSLTAEPGRSQVTIAPRQAGRRLRGRPVVNGRPVPDGTVLAPGRLDLESVRRVSARWLRGRGWSVVLHPRAPDQSHTLPAADTLTAWHPSFGVAWLPWDDESIPSGGSCPGVLTIRAGRSGGTATIRAVLPRPNVSSGGEWPPPMEVPLDSEGTATIPGLPFGPYEIVTPTGRISRVLDETSPAADVRLSTPR